MARGEPCGNDDHVVVSITSTDTPRQRVGQLIDKHGHVLSQSVMTNWLPRMLQIMGVRRVDDGGQQ